MVEIIGDSETAKRVAQNLQVAANEAVAIFNENGIDRYNSCIAWVNRHVRMLAGQIGQAATGPARRRTFEATRILLGGALDAGYDTHSISDCLGGKPESIRTRAERGRELTVTAMETVAGLNPDTLTQFGHPDLFGPPRHDGNTR